MTCTHKNNRINGSAPLRMYARDWPGHQPKGLSEQTVKRLYLWHWDHMQCVLARPSDYIIYWGRWYEALCDLCDAYGLPRPATPLEVGHGGTK